MSVNTPWLETRKANFSQKFHSYVKVSFLPLENERYVTIQVPFFGLVVGRLTAKFCAQR